MEKEEVLSRMGLDVRQELFSINVQAVKKWSSNYYDICYEMEQDGP